MTPKLRRSAGNKNSASKLKPDTKLSLQPLKTLENGLLDLEHHRRKFDHITTANAENSLLLRLPPELRSMIFKFAVESPYTYGIINFMRVGQPMPRAEVSRKDHAFGLPQVCRQVYAETATLTYAENEFFFHSEKSMIRWVSARFPAQQDALHVVRYVDTPRKGSKPDEKRIASKLRKECPALRNFTLEVELNSFTPYIDAPWPYDSDEEVWQTTVTATRHVPKQT